MIDGHVYFLLSKMSSSVKVGFSTNVPRRVRALQTASAESLDLIGAMPGSMRTEKLIHASLCDFSIGGEWFAYCTPVQQFVETCINSGDMTKAIVAMDVMRRREMRKEKKTSGGLAKQALTLSRGGTKSAQVLIENCDQITSALSSPDFNRETVRAFQKRLQSELGLSVRQAKWACRWHLYGDYVENNA